MARPAILVYGLVNYALFLVTFLYLIGFVSGLCVPVTVDVGGSASPPWTACAIDVGLIALFGVQHSVMARAASKRLLAKVLPPPMERPTFLLATCAVLALLFVQWRPLPTPLWALDGVAAAVVHGVAFLGWGIALLATFLIDHFDLFGLRQAWLGFRGQPYTQRAFRERSLYRVVRHPLMFGLLLALWCAPTMTVGHVVFAGGFTVYILIGVALEERDLLALHGNAYRDYRRRVPRLLPRRGPASSDPDRTTVVVGPLPGSVPRQQPR